MKKSKMILIVLNYFFLFGTPIQSIQAQAEWVGGFPGQETEWTQALNWSTNAVPGGEEIVSIPKLDGAAVYYPVISTEIPSFSYLIIEDGASLTVAETGHLEISSFVGNCFGLFLSGSLKNTGTITIVEPDSSPIFGNFSLLENEGSIFLIYNKIAEELQFPLVKSRDQALTAQ